MMIDVDKFVVSLMKHYYDTYNVDKSVCKCWLDDVLEDQGLEYKDGEIVKTQRRIAAEAKEAIFDDEDERIRKEIIDYCHERLNTTYGALPNIETIKRWLAWLEKQKYTQKDVDDAYLKGVTDAKNEWGKQGKQTNFFQNVSLNEFEEALADVCRGWIGEEIGWKDYIIMNANALLKICQKMWNEVQDAPFGQKPAESKPKFNVGDYIANDYCAGKVIELTDDAYLLDTGQGIPFSCEDNVHLWTIQDAKVGEVLYSPCCKLLWIYKDDKSCYVGNNLNYCSNHVVINEHILIPTDAIPATKEQRDTLMKAMADAGYEWNAEKKELRQLTQSVTKTR